jgi:GNAT superfamily N-acetyltransferase
MSGNHQPGLTAPARSAVPITVTYLELRSEAALVPARRAVEAQLVRAEAPSPEFARFLYTAVGGDWHWHDRLGWTWAEWRVHLERPGRELWYALVRGTPAGYFELDATAPPEVEVAYVGLLPGVAGQGLGGWLVERAARRGFALGAERVWLHTCTLDAPAALPNYLARGFSVVRVEQRTLELPPRPPGPWAGAHPREGASP